MLLFFIWLPANCADLWALLLGFFWYFERNVFLLLLLFCITLPVKIFLMINFLLCSSLTGQFSKKVIYWTRIFVSLKSTEIIWRYLFPSKIAKFHQLNTWRKSFFLLITIFAYNTYTRKNCCHLKLYLLDRRSLISVNSIWKTSP